MRCFLASTIRRIKKRIKKMEPRIRTIVISPGKPAKLFYMHQKTVREMATYRMLAPFTDVLVTDKGSGKVTGKMFGIPLRGKVVISGARLVDGAFVPWHLTHGVTLENWERIIGWSEP